jgi:hypothetical protein
MPLFSWIWFFQAGIWVVNAIFSFLLIREYNLNVIWDNVIIKLFVAFLCVYIGILLKEK